MSCGASAGIEIEICTVLCIFECCHNEVVAEGDGVSTTQNGLMDLN